MKQLYSRYFPTPSFLMMNSCALDISDQSIKYGELKATPHGLRLGRFGQEKIPQGVIVSGKIENEQKLTSILSDLQRKENLRYVRISLPEEQMYLFSISLPHMNKKDIRDTIFLQIEEHIPLKADNTIFDYEIIVETPQTLSIEVVAVSVTTIESYLSVFEKAGLIPLSFELEAQALARAVIPVDDTSPVMIVDFGESRTGVSIAHNGRVFFTTTLDIGGNTLTNMIAKNFSLSFEEAEAMKRSYAIDSHSKADDIFPVILNGISVLRDELNKHYIYWQTHDDESGIKHEPISRIILCGGDANLTGLTDYLEASMKIKVEHANAWVNISALDQSVPDMLFQDSLGYATVLGLALGDYIYSTPLINVLPPEDKVRLHREQKMRLASMILSFSALICLLATLLIFPSYFYSQSKAEIAEARLEEFNQANPEIATHSLDTAITDINTKLLLLSNYKESADIIEKVYNPILASRNGGISLSQISYSENAQNEHIIVIQGTSSDRAALRTFKSNLDTHSDFADVQLPISNFLEKSNLNFIITIKMK
jgi:type IV pilus assembly protein PilM